MAAGASNGDDGAIRKMEKSSNSSIIIENGKTKTKNPSLISLALARTASHPAGVSSMDSKKLIEGLYDGVLLDKDTKKFWIDKKLQKNCFMVLTKGLNILNGQDRHHWHWDKDHENCFGGPATIGIAREREGEVDISGKLPSIMLSPMTNYEVRFVLKMAEGAEIREFPVSLSLSLPKKAPQSRTEDLGKQPKGQWFEVLLGEYEATPENIGYISFHLNKNSSEHMGRLIVKGVVFCPKD